MNKLNTFVYYSVTKYVDQISNEVQTEHCEPMSNKKIQWKKCPSIKLKTSFFFRIKKRRNYVALF